MILGFQDIFCFQSFISSVCRQMRVLPHLIWNFGLTFVFAFGKFVYFSSILLANVLFFLLIDLFFILFYTLVVFSIFMNFLPLVKSKCLTGGSFLFFEGLMFTYTIFCTLQTNYKVIAALIFKTILITNHYI